MALSTERREQGIGNRIGGEYVERPAEYIGSRGGEGVQELEQRWMDNVLRAVRTRVWVEASEAEQMLMSLSRQAQTAPESVDDLRGRVTFPALFEPGVVVRARPSEDRDLFAAKPLDPASRGPAGQTEFAWFEPSTTCSKIVPDLVLTRCHTTIVVAPAHGSLGPSRATHLLPPGRGVAKSRRLEPPCRRGAGHLVIATATAPCAQGVQQAEQIRLSRRSSETEAR
jgi:hypothetical protein